MLLKYVLGKDYDKIVETLSETEIKNTVFGLKEKGICGPQTIHDVLDYLYCHKKAFGEIISTSTVAERLVENMDKNIGYFKFMNRFCAGEYSEKDRQVKMNIRRTVGSIARPKRKMKYNSVLRHEIDHCATALPAEEKGKTLGCGVANSQVVGYLMDKYQSEDEDTLSVIVDGICALNEGITVYKQNKFDKVKGDADNTHGQLYGMFLGVATHISNVIEEENMISDQFNGDYNSMRIKYERATGVDLDKIVYNLGKINSGHNKQAINGVEMANKDEKVEMAKNLLGKLNKIESRCLERGE